VLRVAAAGVLAAASSGAAGGGMGPTVPPAEPVPISAARLGAARGAVLDGILAAAVLQAPGKPRSRI